MNVGAATVISVPTASSAINPDIVMEPTSSAVDDCRAAAVSGAYTSCPGKLQADEDESSEC